MFDVEKIRKDFPILDLRVNGKPLVYLDSAATSQKPLQVLDAVRNYYLTSNSNVHRGVHYLSEQATIVFEKARKTIASFINANPEEIVFTKNSTEALNLLMYSYGMSKIKEGDRIVLSEMEHHSNIVPWQQLAIRKKAELSYIPVNKEGILEENAFSLMEKASITSIMHISNALGTINPIGKMAPLAKENSVFIVDASQSVPHMPIDVKKLGCDFLVFTGHKMLGPMGIGILYGKKELLEEMPPFLFGGEMITEVHKYSSKWSTPPQKFEAGTPDVGAVIGLAKAIDYLSSIGMENIHSHEKELVSYALETAPENVEIYGPKDSSKRAGILSFNVKGIHSHDLSTILDSEGIAIRAGNHCAQPLHEKLGLPGSARASFYLYNTKEEVDALWKGVEKAKKLFGV
ncbi:cysteine desulfurase [Candidatus Micrarchaeota archaeon]|nr:cysteine desulfurase [Candidatus Micrarchaeota archaeon]